MKTRKIIVALLTLLMAKMAFAQDVTLRFSGATNEGGYLRLDSVLVENHTRSWSETLLYPDTVLTFSSSSITNAVGNAPALKCYPNPFKGTTTVSVVVAENCRAILRLYNLEGQLLAEKSQELAEGENVFSVSLRKTQVAMLTVGTQKGQSTVKLLNGALASEDAISFSNHSRISEKRLSSYTFQSGDRMRYTGYATSIGNRIVSAPIEQLQNGSGIIQLVFNANSQLPFVTTDSVGSITVATANCFGTVVSAGSSSVTARGVCWDTLPTPTVADNHTVDSVGTGSFTANITGLLAGVVYYVRGYATNASGTAYGNVVSFRTEPAHPIVSTLSITDVGPDTAVGGGFVITESGSPVTARGVCWDTAPNPDTNSSRTFDGTGRGAFVSIPTGLTANTTYHLRAYAINAVGVAYGATYVFTTDSAGLPRVTTSAASGITDTSAVSGGNVVRDGGTPVTARGVCWSTNPLPTLNDSHTSDGTGRGVFTSTLTGLSHGTLYYVRSYATNAVDTAYGNDVLAFTLIDTTTHYLTGLFSVSDSLQVMFSPGNLQYTTCGTHAVAGGGTAQGTWRFAAHQWDTIGVANANISSTYIGWIDFFGWATSGWNNTGNDPFAIHYMPYSTNWSFTYVDSSNCYGFGPSNTMPDINLVGTSANYDWGVYNAISNGGNTPGLWRTLSSSEWYYLICQRQNAAAKCGFGTIDSIFGMIFLPDNWTLPSGISFVPGSGWNVVSYVNEYSISDWTLMEANGAVFLPASGSRMNPVIQEVNEQVFYWTTTRMAEGCYVGIINIRKNQGGGQCFPGYSFGKCGHCVRLVQDRIRVQ